MTVATFRDHRSDAGFMPWRLTIRQTGPHVRVTLKERGPTERLRSCAVGQVQYFPLPLYRTATQTASRLKRQEGLVFTFHKDRAKKSFTVRRLK